MMKHFLIVVHVNGTSFVKFFDRYIDARNYQRNEVWEQGGTCELYEVNGNEYEILDY